MDEGLGQMPHAHGNAGCACEPTVMSVRFLN